ncbi:ABC transporter permease [Leptolyngbya valderiana BDU 20041]|nr:ABC transporter permease subunit [Geitlerinema sp. CS-897]OAB55899.1 ABC transporter permease [Leptolyngbya valderiana BDU 20041]
MSETPETRTSRTSSVVNFSRFAAIATNVFREVVRDRILYVIGFYVLVLVLAVRLLPDLSAGAYPKIVLDLGLGTIELLGVFITAFVGTALINKEIDKRTMLVLVSKPISRGELIIAKFFGLWAVLLVAIVSMAIVTLPIAALSSIEIPLGSFAIAVAFLGLKLAVLIAVAILFGVFTSSLLASFLTLATYLAGSFSRDLLQLAETTNNESFKPISTVLYIVLPDLLRLDVKNEAIYGMAAMPDAGTLWLNVLYGVTYIVVLLALAIAIFRQRQF